MPSSSVSRGLYRAARGSGRWGALLASTMVLGCSHDDRQRAPDQPAPRSASAAQVLALRPAPQRLEALCRRLQRGHRVRVRCPARLPAAGDRPLEQVLRVGDRDLQRGRCEYLVELRYEPAPRHVPYHYLFGGRCGRFPLRVQDGHWPSELPLARDLRLVGEHNRPGQPPTPARLQVERPPEADQMLYGRASPVPDGGVHGDHVVAVWNQGDAGYVLSLHFRHNNGAGATRRARRVLTELRRHIR